MGKQELAPSIQDHGIRNYLLNEQANQVELEQMIVWTKRQDLYRKQSFPDTFPRTFKYIDKLWHSVNNLTENNS